MSDMIGCDFSDVSRHAAVNRRGRLWAGRRWEQTVPAMVRQFRRDGPFPETPSLTHATSSPASKLRGKNVWTLACPPLAQLGFTSSGGGVQRTAKRTRCEMIGVRRALRVG